MVSKVWFTFPNWLTVTSTPLNRLSRSTKFCTSRSLTLTWRDAVFPCHSNRLTKAWTKKEPTSTQRSTVWLQTTMKKATKNTQKASIQKPMKGWKASKQNAPHGSSSTLTPKHVGKLTKNRLPVIWQKQQKLLHPNQRIPAQHRTPRVMSKLRSTIPVRWHPTKLSQHCGKN